MSCSRRTFLPLLLVLLPVRAQEPARTPPADAEVFSGTVIACTDTRVTVSRRDLARNTETKVFVIDADTKIEGKIKVKVRVSVRFANDENGARAIHIIVR